MKIIKNTKGQALVTLLIFVIITITVTAASVTLTILNSTANSNLEQAELTYYIAESGAENAVLRLLRNPNYTGEVLPVGNGSATIQVTGATSKVVNSEGNLGNFSRKIQLQIQYTNNILSITSWKEI